MKTVGVVCVWGGGRFIGVLRIQRAVRVDLCEVCFHAQGHVY